MGSTITYTRSRCRPDVLENPHLAPLAQILAGSCAGSARAAIPAATSCCDDRQRRFDYRGVKAVRLIGSAFRGEERDMTVLPPKVPRSGAIAICRKQPALFGLAAWSQPSRPLSTQNSKSSRVF